MLPLVIDEKQVFIFKFWFNGKIQNGMYYHNELFCQLGMFDIQQRSHVYQFSHKLGQKDVFSVITCSNTTCSLWGSLRTDLVKKLLVNPSSLHLTSTSNRSGKDLLQQNKQD